jgi:hypothetical protein
MKASVAVLALAPILLLRPSPSTKRPVTLAVRSTVPARPVRFTIVGSGLANILADSVRNVADTIFVSTPATLTVAEGPVHVTLQAFAGEPWLFASSAELEQLDAWGDHIELRRDRTTTPLQVVAPTLRTTSP